MRRSVCPRAPGSRLWNQRRPDGDAKRVAAARGRRIKAVTPTERRFRTPKNRPASLKTVTGASLGRKGDEQGASCRDGLAAVVGGRAFSIRQLAKTLGRNSRRGEKGGQGRRRRPARHQGAPVAPRSL